MNPDSDHPSLVELSEFVHDESSATVASHVADCPKCSEEVRSLRTVTQWLRADPPSKPSDATWDAVRSSITAPPLDNTRNFPLRRSLAWSIPLASAALLLLMLGIPRIRQNGSPSEATSVGAPPSIGVVADTAGDTAVAPSTLAIDAGSTSVDTELSRMEQQLAAGKFVLDPSALSELRTSLAVIDGAIKAAEDAATIEPGDNDAAAHANEMRAHKIRVLRAALLSGRSA